MSVEDLRTALHHAEKEKSTDIRILNGLARLEAINGNFNRAFALAHQSLHSKENMNVYDIYRKNLEKNHYLTAELLGLRGMANMNLKNFKRTASNLNSLS